MLTVTALSKNLPDGRPILRDIEFTVHRGEFVGVLGASGAGKSLTLRCILGLTRADSGRAVLETETDDFDLVNARGRRLREARRHIGVIFQGFNLVKRLRVLDNVMIGRLGGISPWRSWLYGFTDSEAHEALDALRRVKMEHFAERITGTLSGGEMQRVAIARAIFQRPAMYMADEPIASLDPTNSIAIMKLLAPLARETPVLGVFHQPEMTARFCTRVIAIRQGRIVYDGAPELSQRQLQDIYGSELDQVLRPPAPVLPTDTLPEPEAAVGAASAA
ncbi:phosphonate ABC transporter ATP-binding protein [Opitutales bacterium ASA1]|uniref:phosphonate ABC transporter ATP-binding protein n=1 Tax=Congregicoccus parvus TaxID=3081749 RepID=UPI002B2D6081|nr:phosphonate ABC transporter ATP-binding protein [Opitutales bacterium ASA1]